MLNLAQMVEQLGKFEQANDGVPQDQRAVVIQLITRSLLRLRDGLIDKYPDDRRTVQTCMRKVKARLQYLQIWEDTARAYESVILILSGAWVELFSSCSVCACHCWLYQQNIFVFALVAVASLCVRASCCCRDCIYCMRVITSCCCCCYLSVLLLFGVAIVGVVSAPVGCIYSMLPAV